MADLYEKENHFKSTSVETNVDTSMEDPKVADVEATTKITPTATTSEFEKGNLDETLTTDVPESAEKLGLENLNDAIDNGGENMNIDSPADVKNDVVETNVVNGFVQKSPEKADVRKDVGPDIETSLGQHGKKIDVTATLVDDDSGFEIATEKEVQSGDTVVNSHSEEARETKPEPNDENVSREEGQSLEKEKYVVDVENLDSDDIPLARKYGEGVAKRLRSNKGKSVPSVTETPKTKTKSVGVGPKKGWSKVKVTSRRSKKRNGVSSSDSEFDVEEDVPNITPSASKKSTGKKIPHNVANVPIDKVSFHYPKNAQRWKYIFHRRLALERGLGKEALECEVVMKLIKEAELLKTVCNFGECYEQLVKEFLVNMPADCENPHEQRIS